jgi:hypothetical protein
MLTALDQIANQNHLQVIKAAIPYTPPGSQKMLSVCVKLLELHNVLEFYRRDSPPVSACSTAQERPDILEILSDIRNYCDDGEQAVLDQWIQIISVMELSSIFTQTQDSDGKEFAYE